MTDFDPTGWSIVKDTAAAILFMQSGMYSLDAFSAVNSSPWTAETVGGDAKKAGSMREYTYHAVGITVIYAIGGAMIAQSWWPVIGGGLSVLYMYWLYSRALKRGFDEGSSWQSTRSNL